MTAYAFDIPIEPMPAPRARTSKLGGYFKNEYNIWRKRVDMWFNDFLSATNYELIFRMNGSEDGYKTIRDIKSGLPRDPETGKLRGKLRSDFIGYRFTITYVVTRPNNEYRPFPVKRADIDNYTKATIDALFENHNFYDMGINDQFIQILNTSKRYTKLDTDEKPHIEVVVEYL